MSASERHSGSAPCRRPRWGLLLFGVGVTALALIGLVIQLRRMATGAASYERSAVTVVAALMFLTAGVMTLRVAWRGLERRGGPANSSKTRS